MTNEKIDTIVSGSEYSLVQIGGNPRYIYDQPWQKIWHTIQQYQLLVSCYYPGRELALFGSQQSFGYISSGDNPLDEKRKKTAIVVNVTSESTFSEKIQGTRTLAFKLKLITNNGLVNKIMQLRTDEQRFLLTLETVVEHLTTLLDSECKQKDSNHSIRSRKDGNKSFTICQYYKAVRAYTESIVHALDSSEELALAYANRSAALFKLEKYADCVDDIDRALNLKFPDRLKTKLYKRKGLCLMKLARPGANSAFREALVWLDKMNLKKAELNLSRSELNKLISAPCTVAKLPAKIKQPPVPKIVRPNPEVPCASDAVALKYMDKFGRHFVATRKIKPGEILAVEKPYCIGLIPSNIYTHCSYCLQVSWTLIPCKCCINMAYCSEVCRDEAWDKFHEVECPVVGFLYSFELNEPLRSALRTVIIATQKGKILDSLKQELVDVDANRDPRTKGFCDDGKFHSDQYRSVYSLTGNVDKKYLELIIARAFWVVLTVGILARESNMFGKRLPLHTLAKNLDAIFVGGLILKHVHIGCVNMHSFGAARSGTTYEHGNALMALCSLFNHSCDPNVFRQWYAGRMVVFAIYPIEQDEQIFDTYGPRYYDMPKAERVKLIEYWNFTCECIPCTKNWPLLDDLPSYMEQPISQLNKNKLHITLDMLYIHCAFSLQKNSIRITLDMLDKLLESIEVICNLAQRPCRELINLILMLREFYQSADTIYHYELAGPSVTNKLHSMFYLSLQHMLSQK